MAVEKQSFIELLRSFIGRLRSAAIQTNSQILVAIHEFRGRGKSLVAFCKHFVPSRRSISGLLGVVVGFVLAISWDQWKTHRDQQNELFRAARTVHQELIADSEAIKFDIQYLETDLAAAETNSEVVLPMQNLSTVAGDTAYLKGSFEYRSVETAIKPRTIYSSLSSINRRIEQRELYRLTNAAMSNFQTRRSIIDAAIKDELVTQQRAIDTFIAELKNTRLAE